MKKYNNSFIKLFQKFCSMTEYGPEEVEPLDTADPKVYKTPRCYQTSRWSHGFQPPGARSGTPPTLPRRSPRTSSTKPAKKGPVGTSAYTELNGWHQLSRTSLWSPRPNRKQQPLPYGLKAGQPSPHMTVNRYLSHLNMCLNLQLTPR